MAHIGLDLWQSYATVQYSTFANNSFAAINAAWAMAYLDHGASFENNTWDVFDETVNSSAMHAAALAPARISLDTARVHELSVPRPASFPSESTARFVQLRQARLGVS